MFLALLLLACPAPPETPPETGQPPPEETDAMMADPVD